MITIELLRQNKKGEFDSGWKFILAPNEVIEIYDTENAKVLYRRDGATRI